MATITQPLSNAVRDGLWIMGRAALAYAAQNWPVLPCSWAGPRAKAPLITNGFHGASTDPELVASWWRRWPNAMLGTPVRPDVLIFDLDPRNGGSAQLLAVALRMPVEDLGRTLTCVSGRGGSGTHYYFARPPGAFSWTRLPRGVDLKLSGYTIIPPSRHPLTGKPYTWRLDPNRAWPASAVSVLRPAQPALCRSRLSPRPGADGLVRVVAEAEHGHRNSRLYWASCRAAEDGMPKSVFDDLARVSRLPEHEAAATIGSARRTVTA